MTNFMHFLLISRFEYILVVVLVTDRVTEIAVDFRLFFVFCQIFSIIDDFFSKWYMPKVLWNFEKSSNMAKYEDNPLFNLH